MKANVRLESGSRYTYLVDDDVKKGDLVGVPPAPWMTESQLGRVIETEADDPDADFYDGPRLVRAWRRRV